jgi:hypothetical protein
MSAKSMLFTAWWRIGALRADGRAAARDRRRRRSGARHLDDVSHAPEMLAPELHERRCPARPAPGQPVPQRDRLHVEARRAGGVQRDARGDLRHVLPARRAARLRELADLANRRRLAQGGVERRLPDRRRVPRLVRPDAGAPELVLRPRKDQVDDALARAQRLDEEQVRAGGAAHHGDRGAQLLHGRAQPVADGVDERQRKPSALPGTIRQVPGEHEELERRKRRLEEVARTAEGLGEQLGAVARLRQRGHGRGRHAAEIAVDARGLVHLAEHGVRLGASARRREPRTVGVLERLGDGEDLARALLRLRAERVVLLGEHQRGRGDRDQRVQRARVGLERAAIEPERFLHRVQSRGPVDAPLRALALDVPELQQERAPEPAAEHGPEVGAGARFELAARVVGEPEARERGGVVHPHAHELGADVLALARPGPEDLARGVAHEEELLPGARELREAPRERQLALEPGDLRAQLPHVVQRADGHVVGPQRLLDAGDALDHS